MSSKIFDALFGYRKAEEDFQTGFAAKAEKLFSDKVINGAGAVFAKKIMKTQAAKFIGKITGAFAHTNLKVYGSSFLTFGLLTMLMNFANSYFDGFAHTPFSELVIGAVFALLAIPLLFIDKPLCDFTEQVGFIEAIVHDTLCIKRASKRVRVSHGMPLLLGVFFGIIPAVLGYFLPLWTVLLTITAAAFLVLAIFSPEFSLMMTLLVLPALPIFSHTTVILTCLTAVTALSFFIKVALGKRLYHFEQYDLLIIFLALFILVSGIFNGGINSFKSALPMVVLLFAYPLASNLIVNRRLADNAVNIILFSSIPTAVFGTVQYFVAPTHPEWFDATTNPEMSSRAYSTFGNPNVYAVFLIITIIFSFTYAFDKKRGKERIYYLSVLILNTALMLLTWTRGAWLALGIAFLAYLIIHIKRAPKLLLIPICALPFLAFVPTSIIDRVLSIFNTQDSSVSYRLSSWRSSLLMLKDNLFTGVGIGESSFANEILNYAEDAVTPVHSHNLFLEIACQAGIFALAVFLLILLVRIVHIASYHPYIKTSSLTSPITMTGTAIFALVAFGITDYIFYSSAMYYLFWIVFGIGSAGLRISRTETDEKIYYKRHATVSEVSNADIKIIGDWNEKN